MENCSFHSQLLSVVEVLAKAAVGEINRRVDDSCAMLRLEVRQSRQDIDLLKKKCEVMEAELRRTRMRARRKAAEGLSPLVKVVLDQERPSADWDKQMDAEAQNHLQQCSDEANTHAPIKEECAEEAMWTNDSEDKLSEQLPCFDVSQPPETDRFAEHHQSAENPAYPGSVFSTTDPYATFPEQQPNRIQTEADLLMKHEREEEPDESAAPLDPANHLGTEEGDGQLWSSNLGRCAVEPSFSYSEQQQCEPIASVQASQSGSLLEDMAPQIHSVGKSHSVWVSAARVKRRARLFGCKRPQTDEGRDASSQINTTDQCLIPQQPQHQSRGSPPHTRNAGEDPTPPSTSAAPFCRHSRVSYGLARRARNPWRPGVGEKRFSCTYCDKSFMRFSQLKEHLRSHTGEKPFSCPLCGRSFTKQCNLIRHAVVHSGEKPYECSLCGKCFTQRSSLKSHQKSAH